MEKSSVKLVSNIMLKSRIAETKDGKIAYLPFDLLPEEYNDVRNDQFLTEYQKTQKLKKLFATKRIIDEDTGKTISDKTTKGSGNNVKVIKENSKPIANPKPKPTSQSTSESQKQHVPFNKNPRTFGLDESVIPEELKNKSKILLVRGDLKGWFFLIHYDGKLNNYIDKPMKPYHALLKRKGLLKKIVVSVSISDKTIFMHDNFYEMYKKEINDLIELALP